jgi:mannose-6-phosphate isomerase-like protein (cupin superfamily)
MSIAAALLAACLVSGSAAQQQSPTAFVADLDALVGRNEDFRRVVHTSGRLQLVLMAIPPGDSIGTESHTNVDQCLYIVEGTGQAVLAGRTRPISDESVVCVPAGLEHDIANTGTRPLKLFTVYGPPQHAEGTVHHTRADAERSEYVARR